MSTHSIAIEPIVEDQIGARDRRLALAIWAIGTAALVPGVFWGLPFGKSICGALRVLDGQVPYRDFWTMYAPGQFYMIGGLYAILGRECLVQGIAAVMIRGALGGALFLLARRAEAGRRVAIVVSIITIASFWQYAPELETYPLAFLCSLLAMERSLCYFQNGGYGKLFVAGLLLGVSACFKHDVAFYVFVGTALTFFVSWVGCGRQRPSVWRHPFRATVTLVAGTTLVILPAMLLLALSAGRYAWHDLIVWPATDFRGVRTEGFPPLWDIWKGFPRWAADWTDVRKARDAVLGFSHTFLCNMPPYVFAVTAGALFLLRRHTSPRELASSLLLMATLPLFWIVAHVQPNWHVYSTAFFALCLMAMAWSHADASRRKRLFRWILGIGIALHAIALSASPATCLARIALRWSSREYLGIPGARGIWVAKDMHDVYDPIVTFIRRNVPQDERIYVGLQRHDSPVINDLRFYYLTGRRNCCRYDELHPGITDRADVQVEIIDAIERHKVNCVILWRFGWSDATLDQIKAANMAAVPGLGNTLLDAHISKTFQPLSFHGEYILMWRKGVPLPTDNDQKSTGEQHTFGEHSGPLSLSSTVSYNSGSGQSGQERVCPQGQYASDESTLSWTYYSSEASPAESLGFDHAA